MPNGSGGHFFGKKTSVDDEATKRDLAFDLKLFTIAQAIKGLLLSLDYFYSCFLMSCNYATWTSKGSKTKITLSCEI